MKQFALFFYFTLYTFLLTAQNTPHSTIKQQQRAISIFNFAEQINWQNTFSTFTIGVLGTDPTIYNLNQLSAKRTIKNKPVKIVRFNTIKDIKDVQLLYVNKKYHFDIKYVIYKISDKNILLVSEGYDYHSSMINIVNVNTSFKYEINEALIKKEGFTYSPTLKRYAISSSEKWKQLYKKSENENTIKKAVIQQKEDTIEKQLKKISKQKDEIKTVEAKKQQLINLKELQKKKIKEKHILEKELEQKILLQQTELLKKEQQLNTTTLKVNQQEEILKHKTIEIAKKETVLKNKNKALKTQKTVTFLLLSLLITALLAGFLIYRNYTIIKRLNIFLKEKNTIIKEKRKKLELKNKEIEQFAYIASHDLKEPLTTITGVVGLMQEDYKTSLDDDGLTSLSFIEQSCSRMHTQIEDLLKYSKLGKSEERLPINCVDIVKNIELDLSHVIKRLDATITYSNLPTVNASKLELRTVFQNLINNAIKFSKPNIPPKVTITCETITEHNTVFWKFFIEDNGIGIEDKHKEKIFAIFQRLHSTSEYEGTGIGLAYCKKIIENLGGSIGLNSVVGEGTTFYFTIPK